MRLPTIQKPTDTPPNSATASELSNGNAHLLSATPDGKRCWPVTFRSCACKMPYLSNLNTAVSITLSPAARYFRSSEASTSRALTPCSKGTTSARSNAARWRWTQRDSPPARKRRRASYASLPNSSPLAGRPIVFVAAHVDESHPVRAVLHRALAGSERQSSFKRFESWKRWL
jgi:hypothetical protein